MLLGARIDGRPAEGLPLDDRGLAYGDGLFETIRVAGGRAPLLPRHRQRLADGCARLGLLLAHEQLRAEVDDFLQVLASTQADFTLKVLVTRGSSGRGYRPVPGAARRILLAFPAAAWPPVWATEGIVLRDCAIRLGINPALAGLKHLNRLEQVLARGEWDDPVIAEGLLCDTEGRVVEGTMTNLFFARAGVLSTPGLSRCGVDGVLRRWLLEEAPAVGITVRERDVARGELDEADEVFVCNSSAGIWPVRRLGSREWVPGPLTRRLQAAVARLWEAG